MRAPLHSAADMLAALEAWSLRVTRRGPDTVRVSRSVGPPRTVDVTWGGDAVSLVTSTLDDAARLAAARMPGVVRSDEACFRTHVRLDEDGAIDASVLMHAVRCCFDALDGDHATADDVARGASTPGATGPLPRSSRVLARRRLPERCVALTFDATTQHLFATCERSVRVLGAPTFELTAEHELRAGDAASVEPERGASADVALGSGAGEGEAAITCTAKSSDGAFVVTGSRDGRVRLQNVHGGVLGEWSESARPVVAVAVSAGRDLVASAFDDAELVVRVTSRAPAEVLPPPRLASGVHGPIRRILFPWRSAALALTERFVLSIDANDGAVYRCEPTGMRAHELLRHQDRTWICGREDDGAFAVRTADGAYVRLRVPVGPGFSASAGAAVIAVVDGESRTLRLCGADGATIKQITTHWTEAIVSADGRFLAATGDGALDVVSVLPWKWVAGSDRAVVPIAFSPDGRLLATVTSAGSLELWETASLRVAAGPFGHGVTTVAFSADGARIALGSSDGRVEVRDCAGPSVEVVRERGAPVTALALAPDGALVAVGAMGVVSFHEVRADVVAAIVRGRTPVPRGVRDSNGHEWMRVPRSVGWVGLERARIAALAAENAELAAECAMEDDVADDDDPDGDLGASGMHASNAMRDLAEHARRLGTERSAERVEVAPFEITRTAITCAQYARFVAATGHRPPAWWPDANGPSGVAHTPVAHVNWIDASAYATWAGLELPTELEWELAMRGAQGALYPWGDAPHPRHFPVLRRIRRAAPGTVAADAAADFASPYGVVGAFTLGGEWCADALSDDRRALRGFWDRWSGWSTFQRRWSRASEVTAPRGFRCVRR